LLLLLLLYTQRFLFGPDVNVPLAYGYCQHHEKQRATDTYPVEMPIAVAELNGRRGREDYVDQPTYAQCAQDMPVHWLQLLAAAGLTSLCEGPDPTK
jgi:hypothetical protein